MKALRAVKRFLRNEQGTETVEWAIIIGIIAVGAISLVFLIGGWVMAQFQGLWDAISGTGYTP